MNSDELKHNEVPETQPNGEHAVAPHAPASLGANRLLAHSPQSSAPTATPLPPAESKDGPATKSPSKRGRIAAAIMALIIIGGLVLGFLPRWHQRNVANADTTQLAIPSVAVVSPVTGTNAGGLVLPAEI